MGGGEKMLMELTMHTTFLPSQILHLIYPSGTSLVRLPYHPYQVEFSLAKRKHKLTGCVINRS